MKVCPPTGKNLHFLVMFKNEPTDAPSSWIATWLTPLDYQYVIAQLSKSKEALSSTPPIMILSIPDTANPPQILYTHEAPKEKYDELVVAISKLTMGYMVYPESEREKLFKWFKALKPNEQQNWIALLDQRQAPKRCVEMLTEWMQAKEYIPAKTTPAPVQSTIEIQEKPKVDELQGTSKGEKENESEEFAEQFTTEIKPKPFVPFVRDAGGGGNCGVLALADQWKSSGLPPKTHQELRKEVSESMEKQKETIANNQLLLGYIIHSLIEEKKDLQEFPDTHKIKGKDVLDAINRINAEPDFNKYAKSDKELIISYRAQRLAQDGVWIDKDFFVLLTQLYPSLSIAILRGNEISPQNLKIEERFPEKPLNPKTLFIYYDGSRRKGGGYHFKSNTRDEATLKILIAKDRERKVEEFYQRLKETKTYNTVDEKLISLQIAVSELETSYPEAFQRVIDLINEVRQKPLKKQDFYTVEVFQELLNDQYAQVLNKENTLKNLDNT